ncbi:hypothetical protein [Eikenella corrodens]|uniref:hypothetical protein n=1 Tax=Eikenella corrodens TaxID=539 RepID=UPI00128E7622|nr:hypothetical protein [Eikenella corrodens]
MKYLMLATTLGLAFMSSLAKSTVINTFPTLHSGSFSAQGKGSWVNLISSPSSGGYSFSFHSYKLDADGTRHRILFTGYLPQNLSTPTLHLDPVTSSSIEADSLCSATVTFSGEDVFSVVAGSNCTEREANLISGTFQRQIAPEEVCVSTAVSLAFADFVENRCKVAPTFSDAITPYVFLGSCNLVFARSPSATRLMQQRVGEFTRTMLDYTGTHPDEERCLVLKHLYQQETNKYRRLTGAEDVVVE